MVLLTVSSPLGPQVTRAHLLLGVGTGSSDSESVSVHSWVLGGHVLSHHLLLPSLVRRLWALLDYETPVSSQLGEEPESSAGSMVGQTAGLPELPVTVARPEKQSLHSAQGPVWLRRQGS